MSDAATLAFDRSYAKGNAVIVEDAVRDASKRHFGHLTLHFLVGIG